jgi:hypothetical protein
MFKRIIGACMIVLLTVSFGFAVPPKVTVDIDKLTPQEKALLFELEKKGNAPVDQAAEITKNIASMKSIDTETINNWRQLITGTIKDVCNDLNVTVNDFIKTPAGMGVSALIIYKFVGKDLIAGTKEIALKIYDILFLFPFTLMMFGMLFYLYKKMFTQQVVYKEIKEYEEKGKIIVAKSRPENKNKYEFKSDESKTMMIVFMVGSFVFTVITILIVVFKNT